MEFICKRGMIMTAAIITFMVVLYSFQSLFCKLFSENYRSGSAGLTSTIFSISFGGFAGLATLLLAGFHFAPSPVTLVCGLLNAVMLLIYNTAMIQASRHGSYAFQMICMLFGGIVTPMVYGVLFLGDRFTMMQLIAIAMMLISFILMNCKGLSLKGSSKKFLFWCAALFLSNGFYAILMNVQQLRLNGAERNEMIILSYLGMAILYTGIQLIKDRRALVEGFKIPKKPLIYLLTCCICATAAVHIILYVLTLIDATILYTIDNGGVLVLSVLYSCILFHEKLSKVQIIGILISVASIVMLSL